MEPTVVEPSPVEPAVVPEVELDDVVVVTSSADLEGEPPEQAASSATATTPLATCLDVVRRMR